MEDQVVKVNNCKIGVKEFNGRRVVSVYDVAKVHQKEVREVNQQAKRNQRYLIRNEDYFEISKEEFKSLFVIQDFIPNNVKTIKLFTEQGYLMLVKTFTDDLAWKVQRELVNIYFRAKDIQANYSSLSELSPELQMATKILESMIDNELKVKKLEKKQKEYETKQIALESNLHEQKKNIDNINGIINVEDNTTQRQLFVRNVQRLAYKWQRPHGIMYSYVYKIINNNLKINLQSRATNRGVKPIDVLEQDDLMEYALRITNNLLQLKRIPDNI